MSVSGEDAERLQQRWSEKAAAGLALEEVDDESQLCEDEADDDLASTSSSRNLLEPTRWRPWTNVRTILNPRRGYRLLSPVRRPRSRLYQFCRVLGLLPYLIFCLIVLFGIFLPSYTRPPARYTELRNRVKLLTAQERRTGSANLRNEAVFIAASLYDHDGDLISGHWGRNLLDLVDLLGPNNVFVSIYQNDASDKSLEALRSYERLLTCNYSVVTEHLDLSQIEHVTTPDGQQRLKRIAFLAEVRNRALQPLEDKQSPAHSTRFDKLLYLNDVVFDPIDAANLLFSTNVDASTNQTQYHAACATDFINPFKFYDTFATRDLEGYSLGVPFYPWFTRAGEGGSRADVLAQKDAVRVKSCWGGMVAFEAKWFQPPPPRLPPPHANESVFTIEAPPPNQPPTPTQQPPLRFRAETDTYWDASECCLIHADLAARASPTPTSPSTSAAANDTGIYMNPYIRVAYSSPVLLWLPFVRRFERLYPPIHTLINWAAGLPWYNPRRLQRPGEAVVDVVWVWDERGAEGSEGRHDGERREGAFREVQRIALPGQFCGDRRLTYIDEDPGSGTRWGDEVVPPAGTLTRSNS